jgi:ABC-type antimicrobial peptide transport system permease subunit
VVRDISFPLTIANPQTMLQVFKPYVHEPWGYMHLVVRASAPGSFKGELSRVVADLDPDVAVQIMYTIPEAVDRFNHNLVVINMILLAFALLGLLLAAVGLFGVISNLVAHRTAEFGVRLALGAQPGDVLTLVLGTGVKLTAVGLVLGAGIAYGLIRMLGTEMPRLAGFDPVALAAVAVVLTAVALFACYWPARRATKVDPLVALHAE